jgi:hypothetical protein
VAKTATSSIPIVFAKGDPASGASPGVSTAMPPDFSPAQNQLHELQEVVRSSGLQIHVFRANIDCESDDAFDSISQLRIAALSVISDPFFDTRREKLVALAERYAVPTIA